MTQPDAPIPSDVPPPPTPAYPPHGAQYPQTYGYPPSQPIPAYPPAQPTPGYPSAQPTPGYPSGEEAYGYPSVAPYAYPPVPPTPPRKRRVGLIVSLSIVAILVVAAAGVGAVFAVNRYAPVRPLAATSPPATASPTASPTPPPVTGDLRKLLLPVPAGAETYTVKILGTDGTITLEQATKFHFAGSTDTDRLTGLGYQRGAWIAWSQSDRSTFIELDQFQFPTFAQKWSEGFSGRDSAVDVPGVPGAWCQTVTKTDQNGYYDVYCHAYRGYLHVQVDQHFKSAAETDATIALLRQQLALLP